jgi:hypothetical protein
LVNPVRKGMVSDHGNGGLSDGVKMTDKEEK